MSKSEVGFQGARVSCARLCALVLAIALCPALAHAQAEPAPENYVPPGRTTPLPPTSLHGETPESAPAGEPGAPPAAAPAPPPKWHIAAGPRMAVRLGDGPAKLPVIGYGGGVNLARTLLPFGRFRLGVGFDFAYDWIFRDLAAPFSGSQYVSHASFAAVGVLDGLFGRVRPFLEVGGGLSVASYADPSAPMNTPAFGTIAAVGLVHLALGLGVRVWETFEIGLRGDFNFTFSSTEVGTPPAPAFQPGLFALGLDLGFLF